jgi:hypothetical protein
MSRFLKGPLYCQEFRLKFYKHFLLSQ